MKPSVAIGGALFGLLAIAGIAYAANTGDSQRNNPANFQQVMQWWIRCGDPHVWAEPASVHPGGWDPNKTTLAAQGYHTCILVFDDHWLITHYIDGQWQQWEFADPNMRNAMAQGKCSWV